MYERRNEHEYVLTLIRCQITNSIDLELILNYFMVNRSGSNLISHA